MNHYKKHALGVVFIIMLPVVVTGSINYSVDPLQIYRASRDIFHINQRERYAGWIRSYLSQDYDSIIMGTSHSGNFMPSEVSKRLGWKRTIKMNLNGGRVLEQVFVLNYAMKRANIKHVLWEIRPSGLFSGVIESWHPDSKFNDVLYTNTLLDDGGYLFSIQGAKDSLDIARGKLPLLYDGKQSFEFLGYWMGRSVARMLKFNSTKNLEHMKGLRDKVDFRSAELNRCRKINPSRIDDVIGAFIKKHPDTDFVIFFPPRLTISLYLKGDSFVSCYYGAVRHLVKSLYGLPNVMLFGFDDVELIVGNFANYKDRGHYHSGINLWMLDQIEKGLHRLTGENVDEYVNRSLDAIRSARIVSDFEKMIPLALKSERERLARNAIGRNEYFNSPLSKNDFEGK